MAILLAYAEADSYLSQPDPTTNYGTANYAIIDGAVGAHRRPVIRYDLSQLPASAVVNSVTLYVQSYTPNASALSINIYRILASWVEGQVTWNNRYTGQAWTSAGCSNTTSDRSATVMASLTLPGTNGNYNCSVDLTEFASMRANNQGMLFYPTNANEKWIYARETTSDSYLSIVYTLPAGNAAVFLSDFGIV